LQAFTTVGQTTQMAVSMDPTVIADLDVDEAYRDALIGAGAPSSWIKDKAAAMKIKAAQRKQLAAQQQTHAAIGTAAAAGDAGTKIGNAATMLSQGGLLPTQQPQQGGAV
jgi:hypothetical protein